MGALGAALLAGVLGLSVTTLTEAPPLYGDEAWVSSIVWSGSEGMGFEPAIAAGGGLYDGIPDYSSPRIALFPSLVGELVFPTSLTLDRAISLLTALAALGFFWHAMRRGMGGGGALVATAALASTWGFFSMSHWVRWDPMGLLFLCVILDLLIAGPPRLRSAGIVGGLVGLALDFSLPVVSIFPGVLLLCAWEAELRWQRVGVLLGGVAAGGATAAVLHLAPSFDVAQAREQTDLFLKPMGYLKTPLKEAVRHLSLQPLLDERIRYTEMTTGSLRATLVAIPIGVLAGILTMLRALRLPAYALGVAGVCGLALIGADLAFVDDAYVTLADATGPMILAAIALAVWLGIDALRRERPYPTDAVPGILLAGLLLGWGLIVAYKFGVYAGLAVPFVVAATALALRSFSPPGLRDAVPAIALSAATIASAAYLISQIRAVEPEAALDAQASREARAIVPAGDTVVGEWIYWWLYKDERFRINSVIWLQAWQHPDEPFRDSFHRICPDYVLLDDLWLSRYDYPRVQRRYPNMSPTDPRERARLKALLRSEYSVARRLHVDDRTLTFWRRLEPGCPSPGTPPEVRAAAGRVIG